MEGGPRLWAVGAVTDDERASHLRESKEGQARSGEESSKIKEEESVLALLVKVGLLRRRQRPSAVAQGKQQASPSSEAGPSKRPWGDALLVDPLRPHIFLPIFACLQPALEGSVEASLLVSNVELHQSLQESFDQAARRQDKLIIGAGGYWADALQLIHGAGPQLGPAEFAVGKAPVAEHNCSKVVDGGGSQHRGVTAIAGQSPGVVGSPDGDGNGDHGAGGGGE
ncbi:hypothetical protein C0993_004647 [Termitomyces sp. T159_Od127]|nr:hypothetical protein C0993_004647 [Termitomyces sp. T159_Od127]